MNVLFVCLGNICRSPTAEGVLRTLALREQSALIGRVDSVGTADYHIGEPPDPRSVTAAARRGYDISALRARQVSTTDFAAFDLLLAMDDSNLAALASIAPPGAMGHARLFLSFAPDAGVREMPDPYYGGPADFERVLDLCELAAHALLRTPRI